MGIELLAGDARFDAAIEIAGIHFENGVHLRQIDGNAAKRRREMAFERSSRAIGNDRHRELPAHLHNALHFVGRFHECHGIGRGAGVPGLVLAMLLAHRHGALKAVRPAARLSSATACVVLFLVAVYPWAAN